MKGSKSGYLVIGLALVETAYFVTLSIMWSDVLFQLKGTHTAHVLGEDVQIPIPLALSEYPELLAAYIFSAIMLVLLFIYGGLLLCKEDLKYSKGPALILGILFVGGVTTCIVLIIAESSEKELLGVKDCLKTYFTNITEECKFGIGKCAKAATGWCDEEKSRLVTTLVLTYLTMVLRLIGSIVSSAVFCKGCGNEFSP